MPADDHKATACLPSLARLTRNADGNRAEPREVIKHYEQALKLNPRQRGAHEYVGEAYLLTGNVAKAEEHLAALEKMCCRARSWVT